MEGWEKQNFKNETAQPNGKVTISSGIASYPEEAMQTEELIKLADQRLYKAKAQGRNRVVSN